ncbi:glycoprotein repeat domain-containing protein [Caudoviricetes sp.]|nr:glycoprotein repeat domain-containing protein [Caudoviricetes sp.]UOF79100.1 glycoprotein repeat domain-containing protein [Caudoviricetes sp.]
MAIKIRKHGTVTASFATPQEIIISHANDSIRVGDGTNLMGPLQNVGGVLCYPTRLMGDNVGLSTSANQTSGGHKTQITDAAGTAAGIDDVAGVKALKVSVISSVPGSGSAPSKPDDGAFTIGTDVVSPIGALADETTPDSVDEGDVGLLRMTLDRLLKIQIAGMASGVAVPVTDNGGSLTVDGTFWQATQPISAASLPLPTGASTLAEQQTQTTALQLIDDVVFTDDTAFTPATSKVLAIGAEADEIATDSVDEGDIGALRMTTDRMLYTKIGTALPAGTNNIGDVDVLTLPALPAGTNNIGDVDVLTLPSLPAGTNNIGDVDILSIAAGDNNIGNVDIVTMPAVAGAAAHDAGVSGNPVRVAGRAMLANGTAVAEDDTADIATDNQGRVINTPHVPRDLVVQNTGSIADTTEATILSAGAAGVFHDVTKLIFSNSSSTAARVQIRDATGGTIRMEVAVAANGGAVIDFGDVPMIQTTAANNWTIDLQAGVTSIYWFIQAIKRIA